MGLVRTRKATDRARHTHILETADGGIFQDAGRNRPSKAHSLTGTGRGVCQDTERNRPSKVHPQTRNSRGWDFSECGKKPSERGALTLWRRQWRDLSGHRKKPRAPTKLGALTSWWQREQLVRTLKETDRAKHTHELETAEGETCQNKERNRPTEAHSRTGDSGRGTCQLTETNRASEVHSRTGNSRRRDLSGHGNKPTE